MSFKVGIIGYGWAATAHIDAINACADARVVAICSSRELNPAELSEQYGSEIAVYTSVEELLASEIDVVSICSYPQDHAGHVVAAAVAGKHIIVEKPLVLNLEDLRRVESAVNGAGVKCCVCFECRYSSQFLVTKAQIDQGLLGEIHYGEVDYFHGIGPWYGQYRWNTKKDAGGSSLLSAGCHAMDALLLCMGGEVESVISFGVGSTNVDFEPYEYDTTSVTILKFRDGRIGKTASVIDCLQPYYFHTHLVGSEGSLLDNKIYSTKRPDPEDKSWSEIPMKLCDSGDVSDHPYQTQFEAFFSATKEGRDVPMTSLADAIRSHEVIFAADLSAATGQSVLLADVQGE
jgi:predicted dehydrogenase